ncbi:MAG: phosphate signaling complex protein PhoU [Candidatus Coatesbacteria bacterium]|nr:phosphate signaling complex protein PhoU [Candidatus Coatesbacteria bacterium]
MLEERISQIKSEIIFYGKFIENMIDKSIKGLLQKNKEMLMEVIEIDEAKANEIESEIEELLISSIAQYEPRAKNLRIIIMALKINNDLERIGDHAVNISESGIYLIERPQVKPLLDIPRMAEEAKKVLIDCIESFITENVELARSVCERDNVIDDLKSQIIRELVTYISANPDTIERSFHLMRIANNLERIADLSTNISEDVIFIVDGVNIKHHRLEDNQ